jgi:hypothetical protein
VHLVVGAGSFVLRGGVRLPESPDLAEAEQIDLVEWYCV